MSGPRDLDFGSDVAALDEKAEPIAAPAAGDPISGDEARRRAAAGVLIIGLRGILIRLIGLVGNVVLARLLLPDDFGVLALAITVLFFGSAIADVGIGASLIRRQAPPTREELRSFAALQLILTAATVILVTVATLPFGRTGSVVALMASSLVVRSLSTPGYLVLEREMVYRPLAAVELLETLAFNGWAIATVYAGWGVWGPASGAWVHAITGAIAIAFVSPVGLVIPGRSLQQARRLLRFGLQFQAVTLVLIVRPLALNTGIVGVASTATLAVWAIADRFLAVPVLLFESLWRVLFPLMSRLRDAGDDVRDGIERGLGLLAFAVGLAVVPLVGASPALIPVLLGERWSDSSDALALAAVAFLLSLPVAVVASTYIYAQGHAGAVLASAVAETAIWLAVALALLPFLGVSAVGLAAIPARLTGAMMLGRLLSSLSGAKIVRPVLPATLAGVVGCAVGWATGSYLGADLPSAVAGSAAGLLTYLVFVSASDPSLLRRALEMARFSVQAVRTPARAPEPLNVTVAPPGPRQS